MEYNSQQHLITKELRRFPDEMPVAEGYARLNATLGLNLTSKNSRQNATLRAARKAAGLVAENRKGCWWWVRQSERQAVKLDQSASQPSADQPTVGGGQPSQSAGQPTIHNTHTTHHTHRYIRSMWWVTGINDLRTSSTAYLYSQMYVVGAQKCIQ